MDETIGFVGLGAMGAPMARRLATKFRVLVHDTNLRAMEDFRGISAGSSGSPRGLANRAEVIFLSLPNLKAGQEVIAGGNGIIHGSRVKVIVDLSTTGARFAEEMAELASKRGISFVGAPISGGVSGAANGTLAVLTSGPADAYRRVEPYLKQIGEHLFYFGEWPGSGQTMKLINNILSSIALVASCEALAFGVKVGLDPDLMVEAINVGTGRNSATLGKIPKAILPRTFAYGAKVSLSAKDFGLCLAEADACGVELSVAKSVQTIWESVVARGGAEDDNTTIMKYLEQAAGVVVKGRAAKAATQ